MIHTPVSAYVNVHVTEWDAWTGRIRRRQRTSNAVVNSGLNLIRDLINNDGVNGITHFAAGTGNTAVDATQTALVTEVYRDIITASTKSLGQLTIDYFLSELSANGQNIAEAGLFNAAVAGSLYARVVFPSPIVKTSSIAVTFSWGLTWVIG